MYDPAFTCFPFFDWKGDADIDLLFQAIDDKFTEVVVEAKACFEIVKTAHGFSAVYTEEESIKITEAWNDVSTLRPYLLRRHQLTTQTSVSVSTRRSLSSSRRAPPSSKKAPRSSLTSARRL